MERGHDLMRLLEATVWTDVLLLLVAVLPLMVESKCGERSAEAVALELPDEGPILLPVRIEATPASLPRR